MRGSVETGILPLVMGDALPLEAQVIATFSRRMRLRLADGREVEARLKGKRQKAVCGDHVSAIPMAGESDWLITEVHERRNALTRPNRRGEAETLAANLHRLCVVAALKPKPDWYIVDRYLCAAELMNIDAAVLLNKVDLLDAGSDREPQRTREIGDTGAEYRRLGYPFMHLSAADGSGLKELAALLDNGISILVGQSGVGKSSLINCLLSRDAQKTAALSDKRREGRHTTVNSVLLELPAGGSVVDSPGVRDYAPAIADTADIARGFREIYSNSADCRFANCTHLREPGCAVQAAVEAGSISQRRFESYRRLVNLTRQLKQKRE
ncbi:MAG: ribosome small subunit-dependent GTPase A [Pseudomonadota bacterium]